MRFALLLSFLSLAACRSAPEATVAEFCEQRLAVARDWKAYYDRCCTDEERKKTIYFLFDRLDAGGCQSDIDRVVAAGAVTWKGEHAGACVAETTGRIPRPPAECSGLAMGSIEAALDGIPSTSDAPACRRALLGSRTSGERCSYDVDCAEGLTCPQGVCAPKVSQGEPCLFSRECAGDLRCIGDLGSKRCVPMSAEGGQCLYTGDCQGGLECRELKCWRPLLEGESCGASGARCKAPLLCDPVARRCVAPAEDGAACKEDAQCRGRCADGKCASICGGTLW
jgi:hypothetical protein